MGIGFDIFKAQIGARLANAVMDSFTNDESYSSCENERFHDSDDNARDEKINIDRSDMLRTLVFLVGNNRNLERSDKKIVAKYLSDMYSEDISLFSIEDKIDEAHEETKNKNADEYFVEMIDILYDTDKKILAYTCVLVLYSYLENSDSLNPAVEYNLSLIKRTLKIKRNELAVSYKFFGESVEMDTDDVADKFEELTCDETMKKIEEAHPEFIRVEVKKKLPHPEPEPLPAPTVCENPREEIAKLYFESMAAAGNNNVDFSKHVFLADDKPDFVIKAVKAYAKECVGEDAILVFDNTFTKNCKEGLLLTTKNIYIGSCGFLIAKIPLADVNSIDIKIGTLTNIVKINNTSMDSTHILNEGTKAFANFLQKIIPLAMQIEEESNKNIDDLPLS